jgi:pimeloyl-ACP methyl ester carboxylesterase
MAVPVTALLTFDAKGAGQWRFVRTMQRDRWLVDGRERKLAADFSAPLAMIIAKGKNRSLDLVSLFRPQEQLHRAGLYQFQPFDPDKTPVVFVHGLMSRPETWRVMVNELLADRKIRKNFQFWFFLYPTGLPVWKSAAELRAELDRFNRELAPRVSTRAQRARLRDKVLVGHSMGGLVSSLQVREGGESLWARFSGVPIASLPVGDAARRRIEELMVFAPRTDVSRVVFAAVPHRGSPLALRAGARFFAARVRFALPEIQNYRALLVSKAHEALRRDLQEPANSIRFLRENSPFLEAIWSAPQNPRVRLHSIIGDRGRNDAPHGGDGIVPDRSAHDPGADSEKIVPSGHDVHEHPEGVREVARILREVLGD